MVTSNMSLLSPSTMIRKSNKFGHTGWKGVLLGCKSSTDHMCWHVGFMIYLAMLAYFFLICFPSFCVQIKQEIYETLQ